MPHSIIAATVLFSGLIMHVETNGTTHAKTAYLVKAPHHTTPRILVPNGSFVSASGLTSTSGGGVMTFNLPANKQYVIVVQGASPGVTALPEFDQHVAHLSKLLTPPAMLHPDVVAGKNHNSHSTVSYSSGTLGIDHCFDEAIQFQPHDMNERCLAQAVKLTIPTGQQWEIQESGNPANKIVLTANGTVTVENAAPPTVVGPHQKHYSLLLDRTTVVDDIVRTGRKCDQSNCTVIPKAAAKHPKHKKQHGPPPQHNPRVECSNTQWP